MFAYKTLLLAAGSIVKTSWSPLILRTSTDQFQEGSAQGNQKSCGNM